MHLPCAFIAQRFGGKCLLLFGVACSSVFSLLTPAAVSWGGANALIAIRIIIGSAQGGMWPAVSMMMAAWIPTKERNTVGSMVFSGLSVILLFRIRRRGRQQCFLSNEYFINSQCGNIAGNLVAGLLLDHYRNWHVVFYVFGTIGMVVTTVFVSIYSWVVGRSQNGHAIFILCVRTLFGIVCGDNQSTEYASIHQRQGEGVLGAGAWPMGKWQETTANTMALNIDQCAGDRIDY